MKKKELYQRLCPHSYMDILPIPRKAMMKQICIHCGDIFYKVRGVVIHYNIPFIGFDHGYTIEQSCDID